MRPSTALSTIHNIESRGELRLVRNRGGVHLCARPLVRPHSVLNRSAGRNQTLSFDRYRDENSMSAGRNQTSLFDT